MAITNHHPLAAKIGDVKDKTAFVIACVKGQKDPSVCHKLDIVN